MRPDSLCHYRASPLRYDGPTTRGEPFHAIRTASLANRSHQILHLSCAKLALCLWDKRGHYFGVSLRPPSANLLSFG